ncbi:hypothetical protein GO730_21080 [Spirosoma sp. HMF3257]|uniref:DUF927 domain-containing protein n=1 Tax=Spirosoma telluris TaxID=2183553 RepID=A0A327NLG7_9BACT|nr:hypothetical protein [Spirosoma telluris]RAI76042.1 hypothetical protein HMF3257_21005 [Spirosoma telluris]
MNTSTESYPFRFEKAPKKKGTCPQCGQQNKFRYYEDLSGNRFEDYGRCERTNECGYWLVPSGKAIPKSDGEYTPPPEPVQIFPSDAVLTRINNSLLTEPDSNFHQYALKIGISYEHLAKWRVGSERVKDNILTLFIHEDSQNRITNAKWFLYDADGSRSKSFNSFSLKQPDENELKRYGMCLFGEHLLDTVKKRAVMITESEKTAVIASWFYPDYDWIAVGSCSGLTDAKMLALIGRRCFWLSDADKAGRENSSIRKLKTYQIRHGVRDLFPKRTDGYDIADAIRDAKGDKSALPELLDEHQRNLIASQSAVPDGGIQPPETNQETSEDMLEKEDLDWENQVGLPTKVWYNPDHRKHFKEYGFIEYNNAYWFASRREEKDAKGDDTWVFKSVSNFIIKPLLLILSKSNPKRIYEVTNTYKSSKVVDLEPKQFANPAGFSEIVESLGNFIFWGTKSHFTRIKMKLFELSKEAEEIKTLGYHPSGFYAFSNGIQNSKWVPLDEKGYGIVEHEDKRYFLPAMSKIFVSDDQEYQTQKLFIHKPGNIEFKAYAETFCDIYALNGNGRIGLLFYISCLFRDIIFHHFRFFPHLYLFGPPQSGKSTLAWSTMHLFGEPRPPFMLNTGTAVAFYKQFAEFRNAVVWFDEYQNNIDYGRVQSLKTAYDGAGHTKSDNTRDNRNKSIPVHSGCIVSGQELPTADIALFTRCILLQFTKTDYTTGEKDMHSRFNADVEQKGVSHLTAHIAQFREVFSERFMKSFDAEFLLIKKHFEKRGIDDRITKNMAILLATFQSLKDKLDFPFDETSLRHTANSIISSQNALIGNSKETSQFWRTIMYLCRKGEIKNGIDYRIMQKVHVEVSVNKKSTPKNISLNDPENPIGKPVLFIKLNNIFPMVAKSLREQGLKNMDQDSFKTYLCNTKEFICNAVGIKLAKVSTTALAFDYAYLTETVEDFSLQDHTDDEAEPVVKPG